MPQPRPLEGIRVVDLTEERGELCGRLLSDLGAEVIKVEPVGGARTRTFAPMYGDMSLYWVHRNAGKLGVELDRADPRLNELLACADVVIDSAEPGTTAHDVDAFAATHPHLICLSITAYGRTGPYAGRDVPDAVLSTTGGMAFKAGVPEREPLIPPGNIADDTASVTAAFAVLCALWQQHATGAGQVIDLSVNEAVAQTTDWSLSNWSRAADDGNPNDETRAGPGIVYTILPCKDGYVRLVILVERHWKAMLEWLGSPDYLQDPEYNGFVGRLMIADAVLNPLYAEHFADMTMEEVAAEGQRRGIVITPILKPDDILTNDHFASRGTFDDVDLDGTTMKLASGLYEFDGDRVGPTGPPPNLGQHADEVFASLGEPRPVPSAPLEAAPPLADLCVMDFGHGGVGVEAGRMFAEYGADVVKIESRAYPDFIRIILGGEMSPSFASSSRSKRSCGVDASTDDGRAFLRRMVAGADIVIENNSTGTMDRMGLGYDVMADANPDVVMVSSQLMGSRGLWSDWLGYGPNTQVTGGLTHLWSYGDTDEPAGSQSIFPDHLAGRICAVGSLAGVLGRARHGGGAHVEVCQVEQVVNMIGDLLAKESLDPGSVVPQGNRNAQGAPWGLFPAAGNDKWVAVCVRDDAEWAALVELMGSPEWATGDDLATEAGRRARLDEVERGVGEWTATLDRAEAAERCTAAGVPAGPMLDSEGMTNDPHYQARGYLVPLQQPPIGGMTMEGAAFRATGMIGPDIRPAPGLGEHTRDVAAEVGLDPEEIERLVATGVLETDPPFDG